MRFKGKEEGEELDEEHRQQVQQVPATGPCPDKDISGLQQQTSAPKSRKIADPAPQMPSTLSLSQLGAYSYSKDGSSSSTLKRSLSPIKGHEPSLSHIKSHRTWWSRAGGLGINQMRNWQAPASCKACWAGENFTPGIQLLYHHLPSPASELPTPALY